MAFAIPKWFVSNNESVREISMNFRYVFNSADSSEWKLGGPMGGINSIMSVQSDEINPANEGQREVQIQRIKDRYVAAIANIIEDVADGMYVPSVSWAVVGNAAQRGARVVYGPLSITFTQAVNEGESVATITGRCVSFADDVVASCLAEIS
jgi:hypothetical protein